MKIGEITKILPHRYPFLLVDRITSLEPGKRVKGIKNVTINEPFFQGHFRENPIMPGVLIIEAMAQIGVFLVFETAEKAQGKEIYLVGLDRVRFRRPVVPGDQILFDLEILRKSSKLVKARGMATVEGDRVAEAILTAMVRDGEWEDEERSQSPART